MSSDLRQNLLQLHNNYRLSHGLRHGVALESFLNQTATKLAQQAGSRNSWFADNHQRLWNGESFNHWVDANTRGTKFYYGRFEENLARAVGSTAAAVFNAWTASTKHRAIILDGRVTRVGFGIYDSSRYGRYWVAHFWGP
jgi:uncharacterized protein YkwD